mmetsp:Transcript_10009/g.28738  ORF Transcript_10009/g.28738 Transcript_10009/m.28738 type:complete len:114 (-) Transcript_10009:652-993(-)
MRWVSNVVLNDMSDLAANREAIHLPHLSEGVNGQNWYNFSPAPAIFLTALRSPAQPALLSPSAPGNAPDSAIAPPASPFPCHLPLPPPSPFAPAPSPKHTSFVTGRSLKPCCA